MAEDYKALIFEPRVKASYLKKLEAARKERSIKIGGIKEFSERYGLAKK